MKELNWLNREQNRDSLEVKTHKQNLIKQITSLNKEVVSNTVKINTEKKRLGLIWRLKKVLGI